MDILIEGSCRPDWLDSLKGDTSQAFRLMGEYGWWKVTIPWCWEQWLAWRRRFPGAGVIAAGIVLQLAAAAAQASGPFEFTMIWVFDLNGLFHLIGMVATFIIILGVARGFPGYRTGALAGSG